ncbi:MAG: SDR family NAD(P)-dependent oxidoreductase [Planctomycetes bacterium]|nr:SDR family NAD(P)-dependent oxidoreductase [Planctomycetota bacterium]
MQYQELRGKKVLVTGASSGIGASTAELFAAQGAYVGVHYFRTEQGGEQTLRKVRALTDGCLLRADMRDEAQVKAMMENFAKQAGGIDILVNNAGTMLGRLIAL